MSTLTMKASTVLNQNESNLLIKYLVNHSSSCQWQRKRTAIQPVSLSNCFSYTVSGWFLKTNYFSWLLSLLFCNQYKVWEKVEIWWRQLPSEYHNMMNTSWQDLSHNKLWTSQNEYEGITTKTANATARWSSGLAGYFKQMHKWRELLKIETNFTAKFQTEDSARWWAFNITREFLGICFTAKRLYCCQLCPDDHWIAKQRLTLVRQTL